jgi:hypothetical protein
VKLQFNSAGWNLRTLALTRRPCDGASFIERRKFQSSHRDPVVDFDLDMDLDCFFDRAGQQALGPSPSAGSPDIVTCWIVFLLRSSLRGGAHCRSRMRAIPAHERWECESLSTTVAWQPKVEGFHPLQGRTLILAFPKEILDRNRLRCCGVRPIPREFLSLRLSPWLRSLSRVK